MQSLQKLLIKHEGLRLTPYRDSVNKLTIGVGRNLEDNGIRKSEALSMLANDIDTITQELTRFRWFQQLDPIRQEAMIDMGFNLGLPRLLQFKKMIAALENYDFNTAAKEMLHSRWACQVGSRAAELAWMVKQGTYPEGIV